MTRWTAVVPLKLNDASKSRLSDTLPASLRHDLVKAMALHVVRILGDVPQIDEIVILSSRRPDWWRGAWSEDQAGTLNDALAAWRSGQEPLPMLVVHGDLPYLVTTDIIALIDAACAHGLAMAPDATGEGTNALAITDNRNFQFQFGVGSRRAHATNPGIAIVERPGLASDIDHPADLRALEASGFFKRQ